MMDNKSKNTKGSCFNTLVQNRTDQNSNLQVKIPGKGTKLNNYRVMRRRAKNKSITNKIVIRMLEIADLRGDKAIYKQLWNTYHCQEVLYSANGRIYGKYCKNRFCRTCSGIRKAELIKKYLPIIITWVDPHFVTLTVQSCSATMLSKRIDQVQKNFRLICDKYKTRHNRGKSIKILGIKSLESNFNPPKQTYNPHLHLIVPNNETATILKNEWLKIWPPKYTGKVAQSMQKVRSAERVLIEIIKYGSKIFTYSDMKKESITDNYYAIYISAFYNIMVAMRGRRIFERFGFNLPQPGPTNTEYTELEQCEKWIFNQRLYDCQDAKSEKSLSGYLPSSVLVDLLNNGIDTELE